MLKIKTRYSPPTLRFFGTLDHVRHSDFPLNLKRAAEEMKQRDSAAGAPRQ